MAGRGKAWQGEGFLNLFQHVSAAISLRGVMMSDIHWVKLSTAMFDDEKIRVIQSMPGGHEICLIWIQLIVLAGKTNDNGCIYLTKEISYTEDMLAKICGHSSEVIKVALQTFQRLGMLEILDNNKLLLVNWDKHQNIEGMERVRYLTSERVKRYREKKQLLIGGKCNATVTLRNGIDSDSDSDSEIETEEDKKREDKIKKRAAKAAYKKATFLATSSDLYQSINKAFLSRNGDKFTNYAKEGKAIHGIIEKATARNPDDPAALVGAMLTAFWKLKQSGDKFYSSQPFTPSALNASGIWDRVLEMMRRDELDPEIAAIIKGVAK